MNHALLAPIALADPATPLADFLQAAGNLLQRFLLLPTQAAAHARALDQLQYFQFVVFWIIGFFVIGATVWFVVRYRRRGSDPARPRTPEVRAPAWLELSVAGGLLGLFLLWWTIGFIQYRDRYTPPADAIEIHVVAKQWTWKFSYPDGPESVGVLYLPQERPVRLLITSRDVIHSFFVPAFRIKQDAVPGRYTSIWFEPTLTGRYRIMCAEFCGDGHSRMWAEAVVLPADAFDRWMEGTAPDAAEIPTAREPDVLSPERETERGRRTLTERGLEIAGRKGCLACHTVDGTPHLAPTWLGLYGSPVPLETGDSVIADPAYLTESMMDPEAKVVAGFQPIMPSFQGLLAPAETAALLEYMKSIGGTP